MSEETKPGRRRRVLRRVVLVVAAIVLLLVGVGVGGYIHQNVTGFDKAMAAVREAGIVEREATIKGVRLTYAEGPDHGDPVLLIHGQGSRWQDYAKVLPELAREHHVFAVDVPGHGSSARLDPRQYTNVFVGDLLAGFVEQVIDEPVLVSGHSSGGLLALRIASAHPGLVQGLLLEDPPLFSSEMPRLLDTTGGAMLVLADRFLKAGSPHNDYQRYFLEHSDYFAFFGPLAGPVRNDAVARAAEHPGEPVELFYLPPSVTVFFQGLVDYDPAFGAAWVRDGGRWYDGFDTENALRSVDVPTVLVHTNYFEERTGTAYDDRGVLMAAMDSQDVRKARGLLPPETELVQVASGHLVHFERPDFYLDAFRQLDAATH